MSRKVAVLAVPDGQLLDITGPFQCFASANEPAWNGAEPPYEPVVVSLAGGPLRTSSGLVIETRPLAELDGEEVDTLIVAGGIGTRRAMHDEAVIQAIRHWAARVRRLASVCTGAYLLAAAGLLDGKRVATHWWAADGLQRRFPQIRVEPEPIFIHDGGIWTSAGVTAGIDLSLALIQEDLGHDRAMAIARALVVFLKRPGDQAQFSAALEAQVSSDQDFTGLHAWVREHLAEDIKVERLARRVGMSERTFARAYAAKAGRTPARMVEALRLEAARRALETTDRPVKQVARECGFGDEERMRRAFQRRLGVCPLDYRMRFAAE
ncbi:AraC family transcriptional regulator [Aliidongia dinghuensis]|uniref:AraC family transcriptional regulator n=1 Tax=Aliidongia dinghuensis TaxID=1867774 RepID=A0A8J2YVG7_9PROT|nr:helix-turn-helix domain-containing protein [Aliidongia dinghuensis]GGF27047.1 AraC family transcriptional regulator [Aliidongia dinghuensis]